MPAKQMDDMSEVAGGIFIGMSAMHSGLFYPGLTGVPGGWASWEVRSAT